MSDNLPQATQQVAKAEFKHLYNNPKILPFRWIPKCGYGNRFICLLDYKNADFQALPLESESVI